MNCKNLYIVEFGEPQVTLNAFSFNAEPAVFVIANDYNDAVRKALAYVKNKEFNEPKNILTEDGSLNNNIINKREFKVKAVKFAGEVIM
jgi:hypothetical protein